MRETNGRFDLCNSCKRLGTSRLHEINVTHVKTSDFLFNCSILSIVLRMYPGSLSQSHGTDVCHHFGIHQSIIVEVRNSVQISMILPFNSHRLSVSAARRSLSSRLISIKIEGRLKEEVLPSILISDSLSNAGT